MTTPSFLRGLCLHRFHYPRMQMRYPPVAAPALSMSVHHHDGSLVAADTVVLKHFFSMRGQFDRFGGFGPGDEVRGTAGHKS